MTDTSPEITALVYARLMAKSGAERFLMGVRMHEAARRMVLASLPSGAGEEARKELLRNRFYPTESAIADEKGVVEKPEQRSAPPPETSR